MPRRRNPAAMQIGNQTQKPRGQGPGAFVYMEEIRPVRIREYGNKNAREALPHGHMAFEPHE
jgi:hypothetical protein